MQFINFVEQLCKTMGIDSVVADVGFDSITETILVRAEQLVKNESAEIVERKTHIFNLQRKLKVMKDQLDSKVNCVCSSEIFYLSRMDFLPVSVVNRSCFLSYAVISVM
jgi:hypothetical protein